MAVCLNQDLQDLQDLQELAQVCRGGLAGWVLVPGQFSARHKYAAALGRAAYLRQFQGFEGVGS